MTATKTERLIKMIENNKTMVTVFESKDIV